VFDRDKNMIESSEDEDTSSDDDSTMDGHRGRSKKKKQGSDITSITKSDFETSTDDKATQPEERMLLLLGPRDQKSLNVLTLYCRKIVRQDPWASGQEAPEICPEGRRASTDEFRHPNSSGSVSRWHALWLRRRGRNWRHPSCPETEHLYVRN
jgi:hypothetical protein